jgi:hypothetical protein
LIDLQQPDHLDTTINYQLSKGRIMQKGKPFSQACENNKVPILEKQQPVGLKQLSRARWESERGFSGF